jgi:hypothetical protein
MDQNVRIKCVDQMCGSKEGGNCYSNYKSKGQTASILHIIIHNMNNKIILFIFYYTYCTFIIHIMILLYVL